MSTEISDLLDVVAPTVTAVAGDVRDDQLGCRTPCTDFTVRDLLNHVLQVARNFQALADREDVDWAPGPDRVTGDWRDALRRDLRSLCEAWSDPAALEGTSPGLGLPQRVVGLMVVVDLLVHGWDLAVATGRGYEVDAVLLAAAREFLDVMGETGRQMGAFGPQVSAPDGTDEFGVLLARTGRDPLWKP